MPLLNTKGKVNQNGNCLFIFIFCEHTVHIQTSQKYSCILLANQAIPTSTLQKWARTEQMFIYYGSPQPKIITNTESLTHTFSFLFTVHTFTGIGSRSYKTTSLPELHKICSNIYKCTDRL